MMFISVGNFVGHIELQVNVLRPQTLKQPLSEAIEPKYKAILDTGATVTSISTRIVSALELISLPTKQQVQTAGGLRDTLSYRVQIVLYNSSLTQFHIRWDAIVNDCELDDSIDVLIGMDIIGKGHLTITPHNNYCFTL